MQTNWASRLAALLGILVMGSQSATFEIDFGDDAKPSMADLTSPEASLDLVDPDLRVQVSL